jgi:hypothetical protein
MANPWHDADGKFCSPGELQDRIEQAWKDNDKETYFRERKNYEEIQEQLKANIAHVDLGLSEADAWEGFTSLRTYDTYTPSQFHIVQDWDVDGFDPDYALKEDQDFTFATYAAAATQAGRDDYNAEISYAQNHNDQFKIDNYGGYNRKWGMSVDKATILQIKKNEALRYNEWKFASDTFIKGNAKLDVPVKVSVNALVGTEKRVLWEARNNFRDAKMDYATHMRRIADAPNDPNILITKEKALTAFKNLQRYHDTAIYSALKIRDLERIVQPDAAF